MSSATPDRKPKLTPPPLRLPPLKAPPKLGASPAPVLPDEPPVEQTMPSTPSALLRAAGHGVTVATSDAPTPPPLSPAFRAPPLPPPLPAAPELQPWSAYSVRPGAV